MPRSNKRKKSPLKLPTKHLPIKKQTPVLASEGLLIVRRAIASAKKHGIKLMHGNLNLADGNCAIESAILNVNDRDCFSDQMTYTIDYYRRIWMTDMKNRTLHDKTWNIYSIKEWEAGWNDMMETGVYERGIFGDLMLFAVACGIRKIILIFNTSLDSPHDPVYICDPRRFGVQPDIEIPVVLAYDLSHYESMHPVEEVDIRSTIELVSTYLTGTYGFSKADIPYLLELNDHRETNVPQDDTSQANDTDQEKGINFDKVQEMLPDHLQGKRVKDMNSEEKKEYNKFRKRNLISNETIYQKEAKRKKDAERKISRKLKETELEKKIRLEKERIAKASGREDETDEQVETRRKKDLVRLAMK